MRVAAVDCGTNSIRLLVADVAPDGTETDLVRELRIVRLGQDVDRTGRLHPDAIGRTLAACAEYAAITRRLGVDRTLMCATSAARDVADGDRLASGVREVLGVDPVVLSGAREAALTYAGAMSGLVAPGDALGGVDEPVLVADLGGGSTELVLGRDGTVAEASSLDLGSVRLTERHLHGDPPSDAEVEACRADVRGTLAAVSPALGAAGTLIGVAGTVTTIAAGALGLTGYDRDRLHHARVPADALRATADHLVRASVAERHDLPWVEPGRADVIGGGAILLVELIDAVALPSLLVSETDLLDGIALEAAR